MSEKDQTPLTGRVVLWVLIGLCLYMCASMITHTPLYLQMYPTFYVLAGMGFVASLLAMMTCRVVVNPLMCRITDTENISDQTMIAVHHSIVSERKKSRNRFMMSAISYVSFALTVTLSAFLLQTPFFPLSEFWQSVVIGLVTISSIPLAHKITDLVIHINVGIDTGDDLTDHLSDHTDDLYKKTMDVLKKSHGKNQDKENGDDSE